MQTPLNPPLHSDGIEQGPPSTIIRDIRFHHAVGGHVRFCGECSDPERIKKITGEYVMDVIGHDQAGIFNKHFYFAKAPTKAQVIEALTRIEEW